VEGQSSGLIWVELSGQNGQSAGLASMTVRGGRAQLQVWTKPTSENEVQTTYDSLSARGDTYFGTKVSGR
jgi:hypothetical protein